MGVGGNTRAQKGKVISLNTAAVAIFGHERALDPGAWLIREANGETFDRPNSRLVGNKQSAKQPQMLSAINII